MIVVISVMLGASFSKAEQSSRIEETEEYALPESELVENISFILSLKKLHSIYQTGNAGDTGTRSSQFTSSISGEKTYRNPLEGASFDAQQKGMVQRSFQSDAAVKEDLFCELLERPTGCRSVVQLSTRNKLGDPNEVRAVGPYLFFELINNDQYLFVGVWEAEKR
ncbi:hypothetical protein OEA41_009606 [Lepraria neglecta]|uniref:Uncharacterized protein n=1 Tax=Lepraria neglecta TaxID=209136 RepID=A0AAD9Z2L2_9LECA|nr:hypothetical protein OEA41_009606 [Lepraria neglecta]